MTENINVLIVEDEEYWSNYLQMAIKKIGHNVVGVANTTEAALHLLNSVDFDIAMVDISLNGKKSGIEIGKLIGNTYRKPFIFITSDDSESTMQDVMTASPAAYLNKPVSSTSLLVAINNALTKVEEDAEQFSGSSFFIKQGSSFKKIQWADVVCLAVSENYTQVITRNSKSTLLIRSALNKTLTSIVPKNLQKDFIRINRAEAINSAYIEEVNGNTLVTAHGSYDVTDSYLQPLKKYLRMVL